MHNACLQYCLLECPCSLQKKKVQGSQKKSPPNKTLNTCTQRSVSIQEFNPLERIENICIFRTLVTK